MSLIPYVLAEIEDELNLRRQFPGISDLYDQHFGLGLLNRNIHEPRQSLMAVPLQSGYIRPWRTMALGDSGVSNVEHSKTGFKVNLDVQQFKPNEISVKVVDGFLVVEGKHEERQDKHGFISRQFARRYKLPNDVDADAIKSKLSSDGVLSLEAASKVIPENANERVIPIVQTNVPAVKHSEDKSKQNEKMEEQ